MASTDSLLRCVASEELLHSLPLPQATATQATASQGSAVSTLWPCEDSQNLILASTMGGQGRGVSADVPDTVRQHLSAAQAQSSFAKLGWLLTQAALPSSDKQSPSSAGAKTAASDAHPQGTLIGMLALPLSHDEQLLALQMMCVAVLRNAGETPCLHFTPSLPLAELLSNHPGQRACRPCSRLWMCLLRSSVGLERLGSVRGLSQLTFWLCWLGAWETTAPGPGVC